MKRVSLKSFFKRPAIFIPSVLLIGSIAVFGYTEFLKPVDSAPLVRIGYADIVQEVNVTGKIISPQEVSLAFEKGGRISSIQAAIGDKVRNGQPLATLESKGQVADLAKAQAAVESAKATLLQYQAALESEHATLDKLKKGARQEEIAVSQVSATNAEHALAESQKNAENVSAKAAIDLAHIYGTIKDILTNVYAQADDAINKQLSDFYTGATGSNPQLTFTVSDTQAKIDAEWQRVVAGDTLKKIKQDIDALPSDYASLDTLVKRNEGYLHSIGNFLVRLGEALNSAGGLTQSVLAGYRATLATARSNVNASTSSLTNLSQSIDTQKIVNQNAISAAQTSVTKAQDDLKEAQAQLELKKAGATKEELESQKAQIARASANIASQEAQIKQSQAQVTSIESELSKTVLTSPLEGILTKQDAKLGEIVAANVSLISIVSQNNLEIEANVPEVDIGKIAIGNPVQITLDAFGQERFSGKIFYIEPAETIIDGVVNFKVRIAFDKKEKRLKTGFTANLAIKTLVKPHVLSIPDFAVIENDKGTFVKKIEGATQQEIPVTLGIKGKDTNVEILSGLKEGDMVLNVGIKKE